MDPEDVLTFQVETNEHAKSDGEYPVLRLGSATNRVVIWPTREGVRALALQFAALSAAMVEMCNQNEWGESGV